MLLKIQSLWVKIACLPRSPSSKIAANPMVPFFCPQQNHFKRPLFLLRKVPWEAPWCFHWSFQRSPLWQIWKSEWTATAMWPFFVAGYVLIYIADEFSWCYSCKIRFFLKLCLCSFDFICAGVRVFTDVFLVTCFFQQEISAYLDAIRTMNDNYLDHNIDNIVVSQKYKCDHFMKSASFSLFAGLLFKRF